MADKDRFADSNLGVSSMACGPAGARTATSFGFLPAWELAEPQ